MPRAVITSATAEPTTEASITGSNISWDASNSRYTVLAAVGTPRTEELQATFPVSRP